MGEMKPIGIVLAGGFSSRMGTEKSMLLYNGTPFYRVIAQVLATLTDEVYISCRTEQSTNFIDYPVLIDQYPNAGPLGGILTAMETFPGAALITTPCDTPTINAGLLHSLIHYSTPAADGVFIKKNSEEIEPLIALYHPSSFLQMKNAFLNDIFSVKKAISQLQNPIFISADDSPANMNTPEDLKRMNVNKNH